MSTMSGYRGKLGQRLGPVGGHVLADRDGPQVVPAAAAEVLFTLTRGIR